MRSFGMSEQRVEQVRVGFRSGESVTRGCGSVPDNAAKTGLGAGGLARRLGLGDAVVVGLGAMLGAGVFASFAPAAQVAGSGLLIGLAVAAVVAYCNATSSARLAALYPESGAPTSTAAAASATSGATRRGGRSSWARPPAAPRWP